MYSSVLDSEYVLQPDLEPSRRPPAARAQRPLPAFAVLAWRGRVVRSLPMRRRPKGPSIVRTGRLESSRAGVWAATDEVGSTSNPSDKALFDPVTRVRDACSPRSAGPMRPCCRISRCANAPPSISARPWAARTRRKRRIGTCGITAPGPKPLTVLSAMANAPAAHLSIRFGLTGPSFTYSIACASSAVAIGEAFRADSGWSGRLRARRWRRGVHDPRRSCASWQSMRILANVDSRSPAEACKPFSRDRSGLVLGEGAAMLVLERLHGATARGATVLCELLGFGCTSDASHICIPSSVGQSAAMLAALNDACLAKSEIDYISAHGTGTRLGDIAETQAIRQVFGDHASSLAVSATKSAHGHLLGAAGALEFSGDHRGAARTLPARNATSPAAGSRVRSRLRAQRAARGRARRHVHVQLIRLRRQQCGSHCDAATPAETPGTWCARRSTSVHRTSYCRPRGREAPRSR